LVFAEETRLVAAGPKSYAVSMTNSRREFLKIASAGAAVTRLGVSATSEPALGLIFPPANYPVPPEAHRMYPSGIRFLSIGVGLPAMTPEGYDSVIDKIVPSAIELAKQGASAISVFGSSITFYKGAAFNKKLSDEVTKATGLPATTQSNGLVDGLRAAGAKRVAVATAYNEEVTDRLKIFLHESGFEVVAAKGLGISLNIPQAAQDGLLEFSAGVKESAPTADALLISCGGLKTLDLIVPLEKRCKVPVVSSQPHGLWNAVKLLGLSGRVEGYGSVLAKG
jgi:arylmalonate decarboxylase